MTRSHREGISAAAVVRRGVEHGRLGRRTLVQSLVIVGVVGACIGLSAPAADAAPSGKNVTTGSFSCPNGQSGTFVTTGSSSDNANPWSVAHLTFDAGGTGIFVPTALDLVFTSGGQTFHLDVMKGSAPSTITCTVASSQNGTTLSGSVTGTIVTTP